MSYYVDVAIAVVVVLLWYGEEALPVVGIIAAVTLYFMITEPKTVQPENQPQPQLLRLPV